MNEKFFRLCHISGTWMLTVGEKKWIFSGGFPAHLRSFKVYTSEEGRYNMKNFWITFVKYCTLWCTNRRWLMISRAHSPTFPLRTFVITIFEHLKARKKNVKWFPCSPFRLFSRFVQRKSIKLAWKINAFESPFHVSKRLWKFLARKVSRGWKKKGECYHN